MQSEKRQTNKPTHSHSADLSEFVHVIEKKSDIPAYYILSAIGICTLLIFFGYLEKHLTIFAGIIFPVYWTLRSYENPEEGDDLQWATYWLIFVTLLLPDFIFSSFLFKIPYFYFGKFLFLCWMFLPNTRGALVIHDLLIRRVVGPIDLSKIKKVIEKIENVTEEKLNEINAKKVEEERKIQIQLENERNKAEEIEKAEKSKKEMEYHIKNTGPYLEEKTENSFPKSIYQNSENDHENNKDLSAFQKHDSFPYTSSTENNLHKQNSKASTSNEENSNRKRIHYATQ